MNFRARFRDGNSVGGFATREEALTLLQTMDDSALGLPTGTNSLGEVAISSGANSAGDVAAVAVSGFPQTNRVSSQAEDTEIVKLVLLP